MTFTLSYSRSLVNAVTDVFVDLFLFVKRKSCPYQNPYAKRHLIYGVLATAAGIYTLTKTKISDFQ
jgi:hypothetical protein